jgi:SAM-dependent methyltransferase
MFFTREALEQASDAQIRQYRSRSVKQQRIVDVCCSIGSDALAFAASGNDVLGIDIDPLRVEMARLNAAALGVEARFEVGDARDPLPESDAIFFDPARRTAEGRRIFDVEQYEPPLSLVKQWQVSKIMVKLSPGVSIEQLEPYGGTIEFISVEGDLKEAVLHLPHWEAAGAVATLLENGSVLQWSRGRDVDEVALSAPRRWLIEPDPALIRAGLVTQAARQWNGAQLDETTAYITADEAPSTPWARSWSILDWMPFNLKKLRAYLRERKVGQVTVKKRGTAVTPEVLIPQLKLKGEESRTLALTRLRGEQIVIICRDL